jgi:PPM family protein phosphatase
VNWQLRLRNLMQNLFGNAHSPRDPSDPDATEDYPAQSALTLFSGTLKLRVGVVSVVGHYREHNEDNFYVPGRNSVRFDLPSVPEGSGEVPASSFDSSDVVFLVADGMGGQQAGEQASKMAVDLIPKAINRRLANAADRDDSKAVEGLIRESIAEANQEIIGCSGAVAEFSNMGTTVVMAMFRNGRVYIAGIGDSRAYRLRGGQLEQLTVDHSLADALANAGTISKEEVAHHKFKNVLYLYLGSKDARSGPEDVKVLDVMPGDRFLLASDGLTGVVGDESLARVLATCEDPQRAARVLVDQALANDSKDNITSLVIHVVSEVEMPTL